MESHEDFHAMRAALEWQVDLGADEAICDVPIDRYATPIQPVDTAAAKTEVLVAASSINVDPVAVAQEMASAAQSISALSEALKSFEYCELKRGARNTVVSDGVAGSRVMIIGEAPGRDEDMEGRPFVGRAGQLLDKMFDAIDLSRSSTNTDDSIYITNVMPWRPPQNRDPEPAEIAMMVPFVLRHIELAKPNAIILMGNVACQALLGKKGITRMRGNWEVLAGIPTLPMFHPAYLLRNPSAKREAWADLLSLKAKLQSEQ